jgi:hypothetical protein
VRQERVIYLSQVREGVEEIEIRQIRGAAEVAHRHADLTGLLVYTGAHFFQVIEGGTAEVEALMQRIRADTRHHSLRVLCRQDTPTRSYDTWRFLALDNLDLADEVRALQRLQQVSAQQAEELAGRLYRYASRAG